MKAVILQSNYLPWKGYFDLIHEADKFIFYDEVKYTKNDWRNRNRIYSPSGLEWLSIPVSKEAVRLKISEVKIPDTEWQKKHLKTVRYAYQSAPFFRQLESFLVEFYNQRCRGSLSALNRFAIETLSEWLGIKTQFLNSADFTLRGDRVARLVDLLQQVGADEYLTGPSAKDYLAGEESLFSEKGIKLIYKDYSGYPIYPQQRSPFVHQVSIIDMMANLKCEEIGWHIWGWRGSQAAAKGPVTDSRFQRS